MERGFSEGCAYHGDNRPLLGVSLLVIFMCGLSDGDGVQCRSAVEDKENVVDCGDSHPVDCLHRLRAEVRCDDHAISKVVCEQRAFAASVRFGVESIRRV